MTKNDQPLSYAIIKLFTDGKSRCAQDAVEALEDDYRDSKMLTVKHVDEMLATAKENGLLSESDAMMDGKMNLSIYYQLSDYGQEMVERYIR